MEPRDPRVKAALAHLRETENVKELNAMVFRSESSIESWGSTAIQNRLNRSLDIRDLEELRARVGSIEAKMMQDETRSEPSERHRVAMAELNARLTSLEAQTHSIVRRSQECSFTVEAQERSIAQVQSESVIALGQRIAGVEARVEANERIAAEALRENKGGVGNKEDLRYHLQASCARLEGRLSALENSRQREIIHHPPSRQYPPDESHTSQIAQIAGLRAALDELRNIVHRQHSDTDELRMQNDALRDRLAHTEEQLLSVRSQFDVSGSALERRAELVESSAGDERERLARLETRLSATESKHEDHALELNAKFDAMAADLTFLREHNARLEEVVSTLRFGLQPQADLDYLPPKESTHSQDDDSPPAFYEDEDDDSVDSPTLDTLHDTTLHE